MSVPFRLEATDVSKTFGSRTVLSGFNLIIRRGEFVAITGASGSGKSTALNILGLIETPTTGTVRINAEHISVMTDSQRTALRARYISFVYQSFHLAPSLTVAENVELGLMSQLRPRNDIPAKVSDALEQVGMAHLANQFPKTLSGGEQQRVAVARALARRTPLLVADEPTGNLDHANAETIMRLMLDQVAVGTSLLLVTHEPKLAARADKVVALPSNPSPHAGL